MLKPQISYVLVGIFALLSAVGFLHIASAAYPTVSNNCNISIASSNTNYSVASLPGCQSVNITFASGISNSNLMCDGTYLSSASSIMLLGSNNNDRIYNCTFSNPTIRLGNHSSLDIIGSDNPKFSPVFSGAGSNITVGYFLTVNVYEPKGYNSTVFWGNHLTHYSYILPTLNNTVNVNNTQLQMATSFSQDVLNTIQYLKKKVPFGVYNETNSTIYLETPRATSYGTIYGSKTYALPSYTMNATSTIYYSPYNVEYSFFAYDQLIMYKINMTSNLNITPLYIQPIYPPFNFKYVPDYAGGPFTIKWLLAIPPQDFNWTFNYYIYRYNSMQGFTTNPFNTSIGSYSSFVNLLDFSPSNYLQPANQSKMYLLNYTSKLSIGINSSITIAKGTADNGKVSYIQDSTTPSFSLGVGYCSSIFNGTSPLEVISRSGSYTMVSGALRPLGGPALPVLFTAPCAVGTYIHGDNITIMCNDSLINDTGIGIEVQNSKNVNIFNCDIKGNGIRIYNSSNIDVSNTKMMPGLVNATGIYVESSHNITFDNMGVYAGYAVPFNEIGSKNVVFYNLSSTNMSTLLYIENKTIVNGAFVLNSASATLTTTTPSQQQPFRFTQRDYLYIGALLILVVYIYLFFRVQYKPSKRHATTGKTKRRGSDRGRNMKGATRRQKVRIG